MEEITLETLATDAVSEIAEKMSAKSLDKDKINYDFCIVAYASKQPVGMIMLSFALPKTAEIVNLSVDERLQTNQIQKKLIQAAENYCLENHFAHLTAILPSDDKTYNDFIKAGFNPIFESYHPHHTSYLQKRINFNDFTFIDLTHALSPEVPHWGVDVGFKYNARLIQNADPAGDVKFRVQRLEMSSGIGTHLDAPSHCYEDALSIEEIPLQSLITVCRVIDLSQSANENYEVSKEDVLAFEEKFGKIPRRSFVIIYTGWSKRWHQAEKYRNEKIFPSISVSAVQLLLERNIVGLGIDTLSPDRYGSDFPVHKLLLSNGKYIVENVANADQLGPTDAFTFALPIKVTGGTEAPIRLIGLKRNN